MTSLQRTTSKDGKTLFRKQFRINGKRPTIRLGTLRESEAQSLSRQIDLLIDAKKHNFPLNAESQAWIRDTAPNHLLRRLVAVGVLDETTKVVQMRLCPDKDQPVIPSLDQFISWYVQQRRADCEASTVLKISSSLNQLATFCSQDKKIVSIGDITEVTAFQYRLHRLENRAEATVAKDIKICKTAFTYAKRNGWLETNPFTGIKAGSEHNPDGQKVIDIDTYEALIESCPNSTWRVIITLARISGLRLPSELVNLKWEHVNWSEGKILITSPKTKRYGKHQRTIPLFPRLETELAEHFELTGSQSEFVIEDIALRSKGSNLRTTFHRIRERAGVPIFPNPFRNLRLSAANDICRAGFTMKVVTEWFGHDMATALKHYHQVMPADFARAREQDPFKQPEKVTPKATPALPRMGENGQAPIKKGIENTVEHGSYQCLMTPTGLEPVLPP